MGRSQICIKIVCCSLLEVEMCERDVFGVCGKCFYQLFGELFEAADTRNRAQIGKEVMDESLRLAKTRPCAFKVVRNSE
jgi:hypothetical protein